MSAAPTTRRDACYFCGGPATTREHVPPEVFFPQAKDVGAAFGDLRANLRTVPSCAAHNNAYSKDDEYAAYAFAMHVANNAVASRQFLTKIVRAMERRPAIARTVFDGMRPARYRGAPTSAFVVDLARADRVVDKIARAAFYAIAGRPLEAGVGLGIMSPNLSFQDGTPSPLASADAALDATQLVDLACGDRRVFRCQYSRGLPGTDEIMFRLTFYEGLRFLAVTDLERRAEYGIRPQPPKAVARPRRSLSR